jgi:AraC family transcriptional regulator of adaptative response / DNA-3-methyladenine glycosylase II
VSTLALAYHPPYDWEAMLGFLGPRALRGVEWIHDGIYARTVRIGRRQGFIEVAPMPRRAALGVRLSPTLEPVTVTARELLVPRLRRLFDLDAQPASIRACLERDPCLRMHVRARPGLRVPGAFDGFETSVRGILGQQVSVAAATTLAGRLVTAFGQPCVTPWPELSRVSFTAERLASAPARALIRLGILSARASTVRTLARAVERQEIRLDSFGEPVAEGHVDPDSNPTIARLLELPGIGPWTAHYIAMRALRLSDAFPESDLGLRKALGGLAVRDIRVLAESWRPVRAYAAMHLWTSLGSP